MKTLLFALAFLIVFFGAILLTLPMYAEDCNPSGCIGDPPTPVYVQYLPIITKDQSCNLKN